MLLTALTSERPLGFDAGLDDEPDTITPQALGDELTALLILIRSKSSVAFERLYVMTSSRLFDEVATVKKDRAEAEALLEEVFIQIWREADKFDPGRDNASAWLIALARRTAMSSARHRMRIAREQAEAEAAGRFDLPQPVHIVVRGHTKSAIAKTASRRR